MAKKKTKGQGSNRGFFSKKGYEEVMYTHDDALVVTLLLANYTTNKILIDNGSSATILFQDASTKMIINLDKLRPTPIPLKSFSRDVVQPFGTSSYPSPLRNDPPLWPWWNSLLRKPLHCTMLSSSIPRIGYPTLNRFKVVTFTYILKMKFHTKIGVGEVRGE